MKYALGNMLNGAGGLNADGLSLDLQFAADKTLTARKGPTPTFTRASTATFVGSDGLIQSAAINAARFDHDPVTLVCKGLLIEESRTNSITGSNAFNTWTLANCTVAASSVVTPEGTADAWKVVEDILLAAHSATRPFAPVSGTTYTASAWIKSAENGFAFVGLTGGGFAATFISVNLSTGVVSTAVGTPIGGASAAYSNGWWRVSFSLAATSSLSSVVDIRLSRDGIWANRSYLGNGVNGMYCYGAQVEAGSFATSYIPTTAASVVRSADVCSITGSAFTGMYNASEGTINMSASTMLAGNAYILFAFSDGTTNNFMQSLPGTSSFIVNTLGVIQANLNTGSFTSNVVSRVASAFKLNDFASSRNGGTVSTDNAGTLPTVNQLGIGSRISAVQLNGHIEYIRHYKKRLANAKLVTLTT